jgi:hypothetical protein
MLGALFEFENKEIALNSRRMEFFNSVLENNRRVNG